MDSSELASGVSLENELNLSENELKRKLRFLCSFSLIALAAHGTILLITAIEYLSAGRSLISLFFISSCVALLGYLGSYLLGKTGRYGRGCWLLIVGVTITVGGTYWFNSTMNEPVPLILLFPIILALVLLRSWELICITALEIGVSSAIYILRSNQPMSAGIYAVECALLVLALLALFIIPTRSLTRMLRMQNGQLRAALEGIEARQRTGQQFSHEVLSLAEDLTSTAGQQATGSQQQVSIVSQVTAAVNELSVTAANIDELSEEVNRSAIQVATDSQQIEQTTNLSVSQSEKGLQAANHTLSVSRQMADLYQQLLATMNELATKNARMRHILNLLKSITDETHLLALNAAIEARGAGVFGERFSIVAQEVKRLASRSAEANREVFDIVREVEDAAQAAESSAQSGYAKAKEMEEAVGQAEQVIGEMRQIAEHSQAQANSISRAANTVRKLTGQINSGTAQQRRASEQVTEALTGLTVVAQQSAAGSKLVSATAMNLEQMSQNLNQALVA